MRGNYSPFPPALIKECQASNDDADLSSPSYRAPQPPTIPRKSSRRSRSSCSPLPSLSPLPIPPIYRENENALHATFGTTNDSRRASTVEAVLDDGVDKHSTHSATSTTYSDTSKENSKPAMSQYTQSTSSCSDFVERPGTATWLDRDEIELETGPDVAPIDKHSLGQPQSTPTAGLSFSRSEIFFILTVCFAQFLSLAGLAQTFAPLMILSEVFGVSNPGVMAWPTAAYSLTLGSCILPAGRLGDMYGHRRIFLTGWIWFAAMSILSGFSSLGGSRMFTACRAFQGIGPALLIPNGLALFGRTFPIGMKRNIAFSLFGGSGPCGVVTGAVMSSLLSELVWWPWSFWCMGITCFLVAALASVAVPKDILQPRANPEMRIWQEFDIQGAITGVGGLVLINFALNQAPIDGWATIYLGVLLGIGVLLLGVFVYIELYVAQSPLIPLKGLHRDAALTLACMAAGWGSHGIWSYYLFLLMEQLRGHSALAACSMFWPVAPVGLTAALSVGFLLKKINVAYLMSISVFCFLLGCLFLVTAPGQQGYFPNTFLSIILAPFGMNWSFTTGVILMSNAVPREHQGIAASLVSTMVNYSISTGLGFAGSIDRYVGQEYGMLAGYRGAWYFGIGLSATGFVISLYLIWQSRRSR